MCVFGGRVVVFVAIPTLDRSICVSHTNPNVRTTNHETKFNSITVQNTNKSTNRGAPSDVTSVIRVYHKSSLVVCVCSRSRAFMRVTSLCQVVSEGKHVALIYYYTTTFITIKLSFAHTNLFLQYYYLTLKLFFSYKLSGFINTVSGLL